MIHTNTNTQEITPEKLVYEPNQPMSLEEALEFSVRHFDYYWFSGDSEGRAFEKNNYANGDVYTPRYDYPLLRDHTNGGYLEEGGLNSSIDEVQRITNAAAVIEAHRDELGDDVADLYTDMFRVKLDRELLVEMAQKAITAGSAESRDLWRRKFMEVNERLYGPIDEELFLGIMSSEMKLVSEFDAQTDIERTIKAELEAYFGSLDMQGIAEEEYVSQELINQYKTVIDEEYGHILQVIPETDDTVVYDSAQVVALMNQTLEAGELAQKGWKAKIDDKISSVSTNTNSKTIFIPKNDTRTANQLRALVVHDQEVHARRGQNGRDSRLPGLLASGTANYADSEEGLGIVLECIVNGTAEDSVAVKRARDRYIHIGLAAGIGDDYKKDAREVFEIAWRLEAVAIATANKSRITPEVIRLAKMGKWGATTHIENIFRGTDFAGKGVDYTKAKVYMEGFVRNARKLKEIDGDTTKFRKLFTGKYDHINPVEVELVERIVES